VEGIYLILQFKGLFVILLISLWKNYMLVKEILKREIKLKKLERKTKYSQ